jgi:hypothetical protein
MQIFQMIKIQFSSFIVPKKYNYIIIIFLITRRDVTRDITVMLFNKVTMHALLVIFHTYRQRYISYISFSLMLSIEV